MVGDSKIRHVKEKKVDSDHRTVESRFKPGMKIECVRNKVDAGTNNVNDKSPSDLAEAMVNSMESVQKENPSALVAYSSIFKRKDGHTLNAKARKVNELLSEKY